MPFEVLEKRLQKRREIDVHRVKKAYFLAEKIHKGQKRKSGIPYIHHPIAVAISVCDAGLEEDSICAALLHDTLEDGANPEEIENIIMKEFGKNVYFLVQALSKDPRAGTKDEQQKDYLIRFQEAASMDPDVVFIKLADLIHNLSSISALSVESKEKWTNELKHQYYPIFTECFVYIPSIYKDEYCEMHETLHDFIEKYHQSGEVPAADIERLYGERPLLAR
ncbi:MAG: HD domain-containing protein [Candidatus Peregrinibacteria bacterium]